MKQKDLSRLNVLIAIESFYDGGAEMFAVRLANALAEEVDIFFLELYPYRSAAKHQERLINTTKIKTIQSGKNIAGDFLHKRNNKGRIKRKLLSAYHHFNRYMLLRFMRRNNISLVHSNSWETDQYFSKLKMNGASFKLISSFHGHYAQLEKRGKYFDNAASFALKYIDKVVYLCDNDLAILNRFGFDDAKRIRIFHGVPYAVANKVTCYNGNDVLECVMVARGIETKGWEEAAKAFTILNERYPGKFRFHLLGEGPCLDEIRERGPKDFLVFHGYQENILPFIESAHICLLPSHEESLPIAVIEYLVCGKPVVATKVGAVEEMICHEGNMAGTIIPLERGRANIQQLAASIESYIKDPSLVEKHSIYAMRAAQKFGMQHFMAAYKNLYRSMTA